MATKKTAAKPPAKKVTAKKAAGASKGGEKGSPAAQKALKEAQERRKKAPDAPIEIHDLMLLFMQEVEKHRDLFHGIYDAVSPKTETVILLHGKTDKRRSS